MLLEEKSDWQLECGQIGQRGARLLASGQWADCGFLLGPARAPQKAHKLILAMASPVFEAMFYGLLAEGNAPIPIPDIQPEVFIKLLQYMYTDQIELEDFRIAIELYYAAQKYMLQHLQRLCTTYLSCHLSPQNACCIYEFAFFIGDKKLEYKSLDKIKAETKLALADSSFEHLALSTIISIFSMDDINIDSELDLLDAAERYYLVQQKALDEESTLNATLPDVQLENCPEVKSNAIIDNHDEEISTPHCCSDKQNEENMDTMESEENKPENMDTMENEEIKPSESPLSYIATEKDDKIRSEATLHYTVINFKDLKKDVLSPLCYVQELPWNILVRPSSSLIKKKLGVFLQCNAKSKSSNWSCKAKAEFRLISHKLDIEPKLLTVEHLFNSEEYDWGFKNFVAYDDILDPNKGYIKDDSITLEVSITAEEPEGIPLSMKRLAEMKDISIRTLIQQIRFLTLSAKEFADYKPKSSLLTVQDLAALMMNITSTDTYMPMPQGFSSSRKCRKS